MDKLKPDADTMTAMHKALGCVVIALADTMPPPHRAEFASNLARLARNAEASGEVALETMLIDLFRAATR